MRSIRRDHPLLFLPGPTEVLPEVAHAATLPMIGHRGPEISQLLQDTMGKVAAVIHTTASVFPLSSSATGAMEGAIRNLGDGPVLHLVGGAFSKRWSNVRAACGKDGDELVVDWGEPIDPDRVRGALREKRYRAVTLVHNETSTGVLNPLAEIAGVVRAESDALFFVDTVSSMAAVELRLDDWGVDLCLAGTQKAWALPPGLTLVAVSARALKESETASNKGYYFDWLLHQSKMNSWQTPTTPPISLLFQLQVALELMEREGLTRRYARHEAMRDHVLAWAAGRFEPFAREGFRSPTLTALSVDEVAVDEWLAACRQRGFVVGAGYGATKGSVIRIGHMGELDLELLEECLHALDEEWEARRRRS
jgi:aspartate aminotransferase-like enzyme